MCLAKPGRLLLQCHEAAWTGSFDRSDRTSDTCIVAAARSLALGAFDGEAIGDDEYDKESESAWEEGDSDEDDESSDGSLSSFGGFGGATPAFARKEHYHHPRCMLRVQHSLQRLQATLDEAMVGGAASADITPGVVEACLLAGIPA